MEEEGRVESSIGRNIWMCVYPFLVAKANSASLSGKSSVRIRNRVLFYRQVRVEWSVAFKTMLDAGSRLLYLQFSLRLRGPAAAQKSFLTKLRFSLIELSLSSSGRMRRLLKARLRWPSSSSRSRVYVYVGSMKFWYVY